MIRRFAQDFLGYAKVNIKIITDVRIQKNMWNFYFNYEPTVQYIL